MYRLCSLLVSGILDIFLPMANRLDIVGHIRLWHLFSFSMGALLIHTPLRAEESTATLRKPVEFLDIPAPEKPAAGKPTAE